MNLLQGATLSEPITILMNRDISQKWYINSLTFNYNIIILNDLNLSSIFVIILIQFTKPSFISFLSQAIHLLSHDNLISTNLLLENVINLLIYHNLIISSLDLIYVISNLQSRGIVFH